MPALGPAAPKSKMGGIPLPQMPLAQPNGVGSIPLSARKAQPLDLSTVERRGQGVSGHEPPRSNRMFGLQEAPTFRPTADEFKDPIQYIQSIREEAQRFGIAKIIPPDTWNPSFAVDTEVRRRFAIPELPCAVGLTLVQRFHFRTRRQELNSVEGGMPYLTCRVLQTSRANAQRRNTCQSQLSGPALEISQTKRPQSHSLPQRRQAPFGPLQTEEGCGIKRRIRPRVQTEKMGRDRTRLGIQRQDHVVAVDLAQKLIRKVARSV